MTKLVLLGLLAYSGCVACSSAPAATDCRKFESGNFIVRHLDRDPQNKFSFLINRRNGIQTETNQQTGAISTLTLTWIGPCTYELHPLKSTEPYSPAVLAMRKKSPLRVEILSYTNTYCIFKSQRVGYDFVVTDTLWIKK